MDADRKKMWAYLKTRPRPWHVEHYGTASVNIYDANDVPVVNVRNFVAHGQDGETLAELICQAIKEFKRRN